jgi:hypothetical protein
MQQKPVGAKVPRRYKRKRANENALPLTHEFLALMLAGGRVTEALQSLKRHPTLAPCDSRTIRVVSSRDDRGRLLHGAARGWVVVAQCCQKKEGAALVTRQATCRSCGVPIPSREGKFALRYLLLRTAIKIDPTAPDHTVTQLIARSIQ